MLLLAIPPNYIIKMFCLKVFYVAVIPPNYIMKMFCLKVLYVAVIPPNKNILFNPT